MITPAEIAHIRRMLQTAHRDLLHYRMIAQSYAQRRLDIPPNITMSIEDNTRTIERLERELIDAGVEVE